MSNFKKRFDKELELLLQSNPDINKKEIDDLLISMKFTDGHIHTVLPGNESIKNELIEDLQSDLPSPISNDSKVPKEVIFRNRQAWGDICIMTSAVRDFKMAYPQVRVGVVTTARHLWDNNPHIDHQFIEGPVVVDIGPGWLTNKSNSTDLHIVNAFRISMEQKLGITIPQGPIKTDLWMTEEEISRKPLVDGPYWILSPSGAPGWPLKMYDKWEEVVHLLKDITIVQIGLKDQYPHIPGTVDWRGKTQDPITGIRDVIHLFYHCEGSLGLVSAHAHIISSFGYPCVVVAGAREPAHFTHYQGHQYISTDACLPCAKKACWHCKLEGCPNLIDSHIPKCVHIIPADLVASSVRRYYEGGVLRYGKKRERPPYENIVKEKKVFIVPSTSEVDNDLLKKYGFTWGGGSVTDKDWIFISKLLEKENIKTILEFGTGLSTLLFQTRVEKVDSFETNPGWIRKISQMADPEIVTHHNWDGRRASIPQPKYDLCFCDGPAGGENREWSMKYCSEHSSKFVLVHDAGREPERKWQEKYLTKEYDLIAKGGHRCHLWRKKEEIKLNPHKPLVRIVSTMRGFGGSEKSTLQLMQGFRDLGYNVEYVSTGNICGPYLNSIPSGCIKRDWSYLKEPCDYFIFYCSDTVWNFNQEQYQIMNNLKCKKSVMVLNYKLGGAGEVEWTKHFNLYLFLNRELEMGLKKRIPEANTKVLAPPTNLDPFFEVEVDYSMPLKLIRHSSQRDAKWPDYSNELIEKITLVRPDVQFYFMPPRSDCINLSHIHTFKVNEMSIPDFLKQGNCFWYHLPNGYTEGGPRVIMEAMASGIPCIVDDHSGMADRVTQDTGWKCRDEYHMLDVIRTLSEDDLRRKGIKARERARKEFVKERWIEEILK